MQVLLGRNVGRDHAEDFERYEEEVDSVGLSIYRNFNDGP